MYLLCEKEKYILHRCTHIYLWIYMCTFDTLISMNRKRKTRDQRALQEETLTSFLKIISSLKKKIHVRNVVEKIQLKIDTLRKDRAMNTITHLEKDGYIKLERNVYPKLSKKGHIYLEMISQKQKKHWDRRFRIVVTDNIEMHLNNKTYLRAKIKEYGFLQFARGLWIYPYPCDAFLELLSIEYTQKTPLTHFIAQDNDSLSVVRKHFRLR